MIHFTKPFPKREQTKMPLPNKNTPTKKTFLFVLVHLNREKNQFSVKAFLFRKNPTLNRIKLTNGKAIFLPRGCIIKLRIRQMRS